MADKKDIVVRFGTFFMAMLFLVTAVAFTAVIFWQSRNEDKNAAQQAAIQEALDQANNQQDATECNIQVPESAPAEGVPEVFKPEGDVTKLQTTDLKEGTGRTAKAGDCLVVKYHGTLASNGEKFDGNFDEETALQFKVGTGTVIEGWDQGMIGIKEGGVRRLVIPSELGYKESGSGDVIPPNADLVFVVKLVKIKDQ